jgi:hypothetical protein
MPAALLLRIVFWLWLGSAVAAGHLLLLQRIPPAALPALILSLTGIAVIAFLRIPLLRDWLDALDPRSLVLLHLARFAGIYFLVLHHRGVLPRDFALSAGVGHIVVAAMALPVAYAPLPPPLRLRAISIWNVVGFIDMLLVIAAMVRLGLASSVQFLPLSRLPLSLVPTFLMPFLLATHILIHVRVARARRE